MQRILLLVSLLSAVVTYAQKTSDLFKVAAQQPVTSNFQDNQKFFADNEITELERQRKINNTVGYIFLGLGIAGAASGIELIHRSRNDQEGLGATIGTMITVAGGLHLGASVPFFIKAHRKKKERDELQNLYQPSIN